MDTIKMKVEGLTCAHCGAKIENDAKKMFGDSNVILNLINQEITISTNKNKSDTISNVSEIVNKYEPSVKVYEVEKSSYEYEENSELSNIKNNIILGVIFFISALILNSINIQIPNKYTICVSLFIISYIILGCDILLSSIKNLIKLNISNLFDEKFLMSIATIGAILIGEFSEAVFVMLLYQIGEYFQTKAVEKSRKSIKSLINLRPDKINIEKDNDIISVSPEDVKIGDIVVVKAGERIGIDGTVIYGQSRVDTSAITGESVPRGIKTGDDVISGSINVNGIIKIEAKKTFTESTMFKILELVENASAKKSKTEQFITKFAKVYTPAIVLSAIALTIIPSAITPEADFKIWLMRALTFLVISCPCALVLSVPLGFFSGIGEASKNGILVKGSSYINALSNVETVVLDKTGTITEGVFKVSNVFVNEKNSNEYELLSLVYTAESVSNHPIAISISEYCREKNIDKLECENYDEISGKGIIAEYDGNKIIVGNEKIMNDNNIDYIKNTKNGSIVYVAKNNSFIGSINVSDIIKQDSKYGIKALKDIGVKTITMLTGDTNENAYAVSKQLEIDNYYSNLLPNDKVSILEDILEKSNGKTIFVGDGINDAPVLARADIGIAMGGIGSDAAIESADIVIMNDCISKISDAIKISKNTVKIVNINIIMSITIKLLALILGAFGFIDMWIAILADVGVTVLAVLNSMRKKL